MSMVWAKAVECDAHLYADDSGLLFQQKNVTEIKKTVNQRRQQYLSLVVDNKLRMNFGVNKTK